jgi:hypothetical protein
LASQSPKVINETERHVIGSERSKWKADRRIRTAMVHSRGEKERLSLARNRNSQTTLGGMVVFNAGFGNGGCSKAQQAHQRYKGRHRRRGHP